jgi:hypothetical protein
LGVAGVAVTRKLSGVFVRFRAPLREYVEVGRKLLTFIQSIDLNDAKRFKGYLDEFINSKLKMAKSKQ